MKLVPLSFCSLLTVYHQVSQHDVAQGLVFPPLNHARRGKYVGINFDEKTTFHSATSLFAASTGLSSENGKSGSDCDHPVHLLGEDHGKSHGGMNHGSFPTHELSHRAKHVGFVETSKILAERFFEATERIVERVGKRTGSRVTKITQRPAVQKIGKTLSETYWEALIQRFGRRFAKRTSQRVGDPVLTRSGKKIAERAGEMISERAGERLVNHGVIQRAGENLAERAAGQSGKYLIEHAGEHLAEGGLGRTIERVSERFVKKELERATEKAAERTSYRFVKEGLERAGERVSQSASERLVERGMERASERLVERGMERASERFLEGGLEQAAEKLSERAANGLVARSADRLAVQFTETSIERSAERASGQALKHVGEKIGSFSTGKHCIETAAGRQQGVKVLKFIGRGALIAVPTIGGILAAFILHQDLLRLRQERQQKIRALWTAAAVADGMDVVTHAGIVFFLLAVGSHHVPVWFERISLACALVSTVCAVSGDWLSYKVLAENKIYKTANA